MAVKDDFVDICSKKAQAEFVQYLKEMEELRKRIRIEDDGYITIDIVYPYEFEVDRCNTPLKLLGWVYHLSEKTWATKDVLSMFILVVSEHFGWEIHSV